MEKYELVKGEGRAAITLAAHPVGSELVVYIFNKNAHIGAVAVGHYDTEEARASSSVITLPGHRDDEIAQKQARIIATHTRKPVCVIVGIHLDNITPEEIKQITEGADSLVAELIDRFLS